MIVPVSAAVTEVLPAAVLLRSNSATPAVCAVPVEIPALPVRTEAGVLSRSNSATPAVVIVPVVR